MTVEDIAYHTQAVRRRGAPIAPLLADRCRSYLCHPEQDFANAAIVMRGRQHVSLDSCAAPVLGGNGENAGGTRGAGLRPPWPDPAVGQYFGGYKVQAAAMRAGVV